MRQPTLQYNSRVIRNVVLILRVNRIKSGTLKTMRTNNNNLGIVIVPRLRPSMTIALIVRRRTLLTLR